MIKEATEKIRVIPIWKGKFCFDIRLSPLLTWLFQNRKKRTRTLPAMLWPDISSPAQSLAERRRSPLSCQSFFAWNNRWRTRVRPTDHLFIVCTMSHSQWQWYSLSNHWRWLNNMGWAIEILTHPRTHSTFSYFLLLPSCIWTVGASNQKATILSLPR